MNKTTITFALSLLSSLLAGQALAGFSEFTLQSGGVERGYLLYVPDNRREGSLPLVFSFHGSGGVPQNQVDTSHFDTLADQYGFAVAFPAGAFTNSVTERSWNANVEPGVDDVQLVMDIIADVDTRISVDRTRIYASGMSGGGRISSRLACELSDVLAAAAPVAGLQYPDDCTPVRAIPIITFHGMADAVNQYQVSADSRPYWRMGVETALDKWRQANGCSLANDDERLTEQVMIFSWHDCSGNAEIVFYQIANGGHTWPGSDMGGGGRGRAETNMDIDASAQIWDFFSRHQLGE